MLLWGFVVWFFLTSAVAAVGLYVNTNKKNQVSWALILIMALVGLALTAAGALWNYGVF